MNCIVSRQPCARNHGAGAAGAGMCLTARRPGIRRLGPGRIVYGNDYPWVTRESVRQELERVDTLVPRAAERALVMGGSLQALLSRSGVPTQP